MFSLFYSTFTSEYVYAVFMLFLSSECVCAVHSAHAASSVKTWRTKSSIEFPQPHVVYAQGTNGRWSLNTGAVIELLCGY